MEDAESIAALNAAVADDLTRRHGKGQWSAAGTVKGVRWHLRSSTVLVARSANRIVGTLRLATKKPWAIDTSYFTPCDKALYVLGLAVHPIAQRQGLGRRLVERGKQVAAAWPSDAIRLDAYDADAGAGEFYRK